MPGIIVDIGTGDGEFVYSLARENPDRFIIGLDPDRRGLQDVSSRIDKKPEKGGLENALFVLGSVEALPEEFNGLCNQVFINFPWAALLAGLLKADGAVWKNIKRICRPGAFIDILFSYEQSVEGRTFRQAGLPDVNAAYLKNIMAPAVAKLGFSVLEIKDVLPEEIKRYHSSWAKKLAYGKDRQYYYLRVKSI